MVRARLCGGYSPYAAEFFWFLVPAVIIISRCIPDNHDNQVFQYRAPGHRWSAYLVHFSSLLLALLTSPLVSFSFDRIDPRYPDVPPGGCSCFIYSHMNPAFAHILDDILRRRNRVAIVLSFSSRCSSRDLKYLYNCRLFPQILELVLETEVIA